MFCQGFGETAKRFENQVNPEGDLAAISDAGNEFLRNQPGEGIVTLRFRGRAGITEQYLGSVLT